MELMKAIGDLIGTFIWPAVLVFILLYFRSSVRKLFERLDSAEVAGNKFSFGKQLEQVEKKTEEALEQAERDDKIPEVGSPLQQGSPGSPLSNEPPQEAPLGSPQPAEPGHWGHDPSQPRDADASLSSSYFETVMRKQLVTLLQATDPNVDPAGVIVLSWVNVELALRDLYLSAGGKSKTGIVPAYLMIRELKPILSSASVEALDGLQRMRNEVAHGRNDVSAAEGLAYTQAATNLVGLIRATIAQLPHDRVVD